MRLRLYVTVTNMKTGAANAASALVSFRFLVFGFRKFYVGEQRSPEKFLSP